MIKRIIELTHGSYVHLHHRQLVIEQDGQCVASAPAEDVGLLLLAHPANVITQQALACCQQYGVAIAVCDEHHLPSALMLPLDGHSLHTEILRQQVAASPAAQAALWQAVMRGKISAQAEVLAKLGRPGEARLRRLAEHVRPGDPDNLEAQAAAAYWRSLLPEGEHRQPGRHTGVNALLDYGYAILRAAVARAVVAAGLHPAWGIFHHNRQDNFALADDLMEPLRPAVDWLACRHIRDPSQGLSPGDKRALLAMLAAQVQLGDVRLPLWVALGRYIAQAKQAWFGENLTVEIPKWLFLEDTEPCG